MAILPHSDSDSEMAPFFSCEGKIKLNYAREAIKFFALAQLNSFRWRN